MPLYFWENTKHFASVNLIFNLILFHKSDDDYDDVDDLFGRMNGPIHKARGSWRAYSYIRCGKQRDEQNHRKEDEATRMTWMYNREPTIEGSRARGGWGGGLSNGIGQPSKAVGKFIAVSNKFVAVALSVG